MSQFEEELTLHLERANELGRRAKQSNNAVERELRETSRIAEAIHDAATEREEPHLGPRR